MAELETIESGNFTFTKTAIDGVVIVDAKVFGDSRGYFTETYSRRDFAAGGIDCEFLQDNQSKSSKGVLRGLHYQKGECSQAKLVRVIQGAVYDVAVDIRKGSPTFGQYVGVELTEDNHRQFFIPRHFAHGFLVLSDEAVFAYKCDNFYAPQADAGVMWNDPDIAIAWPEVDAPVLLSEKDQRHPLLSQIDPE